MKQLACLGTIQNLTEANSKFIKRYVKVFKSNSKFIKRYGKMSSVIKNSKPSNKQNTSSNILSPDDYKNHFPNIAQTVKKLASSPISHISFMPVSPHENIFSVNPVSFNAVSQRFPK